MKKLILSVFVSALAVFPLFSLSASQEGKEEEIVILPSNSFDTERPNRTSVPIEAYYNSALCSIFVFFSENLGPVKTTITNLSSGDIIEDTINAYSTPALLFISGAEGLYLIRFSLNNGDEYYGELEL